MGDTICPCHPDLTWTWFLVSLQAERATQCTQESHAPFAHGIVQSQLRYCQISRVLHVYRRPPLYLTLGADVFALAEMKETRCWAPDLRGRLDSLGEFGNQLRLHSAHGPRVFSSYRSHVFHVAIYSSRTAYLFVAHVPRTLLAMSRHGSGAFHLSSRPAAPLPALLLATGLPHDDCQVCQAASHACSRSQL